MARSRQENSGEKPGSELKIKVYGDGLVISRGARLRPIKDFHGVAEAAKVKKAAIKQIKERRSGANRY